MTRRKIVPPNTPDTPVKATDAEVTRRVNAVYKLLVLGTGRAAILQLAAGNWKVSERQGDEYIARAREILKEQTDRDKDRNLEMAMARMNEVYHQGMTAKNYKVAISAQIEINKLLGLYAPVNANVNLSGTVAVKGYANFSPDQWDKTDDPSA